MSINQRRLRGALAVLCGWLAVGTAAARDVAVRMIVTTPPAATEPDKIYVSMSTDDWPESGRPLTRVAERLYEIRLTLPAESILSYKFMRESSWRTVEKDLRGEEIGNRNLKVPADVSEVVAFHDVARWADQPEPPARVARFSAAKLARLSTGEESHTRTGDIRAHPTLLDEKSQVVREIQVYLPPGYDEQKQRRYPVVYMQDGQNLFDAETAFGGNEWGLDETLEQMIAEKKLPPVIVVAVYNSPDRLNEYSPMPDAAVKAGGGADKFLDFLAGTVKPFVDRTYRTQADRAHTAIGGSSLGGVFALYAVWKRPDVFSRAAVLSPPCFWGDGGLIRMVGEMPLPKDVRIWLDLSTAEGREEGRTRHLESCRALADALKAKGLTADASLHYEEIPGGTHNEASWGARIGRVFEYLLKD
jgi:predicted alpha/beta superfamily hydrolase